MKKIIQYLLFDMQMSFCFLNYIFEHENLYKTRIIITGENSKRYVTPENIIFKEFICK